MSRHYHYWSRLLTVAGLLVVLLAPAGVASAAGKTVKRPLSDFLSTQGTHCFDDGTGGCILFVPPDPNFVGWSNDPDSLVVRFAGVDYAGLANAYPNGVRPQITGTVTERLLNDGRAEVTVELHTKGANAWVIELDLAGDVLDQIANRPTLFGHRPADVLGGASQALADTFLRLVIITAGPDAPLPDLVALLNVGVAGVETRSVEFRAHGDGPLTAEYGVPDGTPGSMVITQTGMFFHQVNNPNCHFDPDLGWQGTCPAVADGFPAERVDLHVHGPQPVGAGVAA